MVSYSLKKLRAPDWREWRKRHQPQLEVRLQPGRERELYAQLVRDFCGAEANPRLAEDDVMQITIAAARGWQLAMRDNNAVRVARDLGVVCIGLSDLLRSSQSQLPLTLAQDERT